MEHVREIREDEAAGTVAVTYAEIRRVLGLPFVPLVYRVLANEPDRLAGIWAELEPNLGSDVAREAAHRLAATPPLEVNLRVRGWAEVQLDHAAAQGTVAAFLHSNALNLVGLSALLAGVDAPSATGPARRMEPISRSILPMADLAALPASTVALLEEMSVPISGPAKPIVIPSLFRHFADDERLLTTIWRTIQPTVDSAGFAGAVETIRGEARRVGLSLPYRVARVDDMQTRCITGRFVGVTSAMLVVAQLMVGVFSSLKVRLHR